MPVYITELIIPRGAATETPRNFILLVPEKFEEIRSRLSQTAHRETGGGTQQTSLKANLNFTGPRIALVFFELPCSYDTSPQEGTIRLRFTCRRLLSDSLKASHRYQDC